MKQLESTIRNKLLESYKPAPAAQEPDHSDENIEALPSPNSELEKRANRLTAFFYEMAVHQPRLDEVHNNTTESTVEAVEEEQLLKRFGDMFDRDVDLHNTLDEEKWSTDTAKVSRRRDSISTNLPKTMPTGPRDRMDQGKCASWTFEDYESTAHYIEQLMMDVATNTTQQQEMQDLADAERRRAVMTQLIASWQYTQHRVSKAETKTRLDELEQQRRCQWMQSQYVQVYGDVASAKRGDKAERPALILPKQRFLLQQQSLPANAIWEVPGSSSNQTALLLSGPIAAAGVVSPARPMGPSTEKFSPSPSKLRPQRPLQRPVTVTAAERPSNITALRSAAILRARVRQIRSAHSTARDDSTPNRLQDRRITSVLSPTRLEQQKQETVFPQQEEPVDLDIPVPLLTVLTEAQAGVKEGNTQLHDSPTPVKSVNSTHVIGGPTLTEVAPTSSAVSHPPIKLDSPASTDTNDASTVRSAMKTAARKKRLKKKKTPNDARFRCRVLELVSISAKLQAVADEEWKEVQGIEHVKLSSVPFLPNYSSKRKPNS